MVKMHVSIDIELEMLSKSELQLLRGQIEHSIAEREVMVTDHPKFRFAYYAQLIERFGKERVVSRYQDDMKCTALEARDYMAEFIKCRRCAMFGGYVRMYTVGNIHAASWVCPHCGIPPLPEGAVEVEDEIPQRR